MRPSSSDAASSGRVCGALQALDDAARAEFWASLALRHTRGLGARSCKRLLAFFGSALAAVRGTARWQEAGIGPDKAALLGSGSWRVTAREEWDACRRLCGTVLLWTDARYPAQLREVPDPPVFLYCRGDMSLLRGPCVAVVGRRDCTRAGMRATADLARGVAAAGVTVVSGMALGIDRAAHRAALEQRGGTIAVLGAGLDVEYPRGNGDLRRGIERRGLLLTEYAPRTQPSARHFPVRNRIISGLSLGVLVVEAALRSGSLITARLALEQNRAVYVLPDLIARSGAAIRAEQPAASAGTTAEEAAVGDGCAELLAQGALGVHTADDILRDLHPQLRGFLRARAERPVAESSVARSGAPRDAAASGQGSPAAPAGDGTEERILAATCREPLHADALCRELGLSPAEVGAALIMLEVQGRLRRLPDLRYAPK